MHLNVSLKYNKRMPKMETQFYYKLNFDGCSKGNPGLAGAGAVIYNLDDEYWADSFFVGENFTNNFAEYTGLILGLQKAKALGIKQLKVEGDSLLVINHMKGLYKCKSNNLIDLYKKASELASHFEIIDYEHIFRSKNKRADELSNMAVEKYLEENEIN
jgi:ribonuclease HI